MKIGNDNESTEVGDAEPHDVQTLITQRFLSYTKLLE